MVSVIIGTHGKMSQEILNSAKMICGEQDNVACITFEPGESTKLLFEKYDELFKKLNTSDGVLIMVDLLNGSPFNACVKRAALHENIEIVTGINMPMLLDVVMSREFSNLKELVEIAQNSGTGGIQTLQQILSNDEMEDL
jgi:PTS system mannose-specific IIA component